MLWSFGNTNLFQALGTARQGIDLRCCWVYSCTVYYDLLLKEMAKESWVMKEHKRSRRWCIAAVATKWAALEADTTTAGLIWYVAYQHDIPNMIYWTQSLSFCILTTMRSLKRKTSRWCAACFWALLTSVTSKSRLQHTNLLWGTERTCKWRNNKVSLTPDWGKQISKRVSLNNLRRISD